MREGATAVDANRYVIQKGLEQQLVLDRYQSHGRTVASEDRSKFYLIRDAVRLNRTDAALVRVIVPIDPVRMTARRPPSGRPREFVEVDVSRCCRSTCLPESHPMLQRTFRHRLVVSSSPRVGCGRRKAADHVERGHGIFRGQAISGSHHRVPGALQADPKLGDVRLKLGDAYMATNDPRNALRETCARPTSCRTASRPT